MLVQGLPQADHGYQILRRCYGFVTAGHIADRWVLDPMQQFYRICAHIAADSPVKADTGRTIFGAVRSPSAQA
jgi:hypothetical protein